MQIDIHSHVIPERIVAAIAATGFLTRYAKRP